MAENGKVVSFETAQATAPGALRRLARAKVNLFLHLRGLREDGYHLLESLVVFPELGDVIELEPGPGLGLALDGPFAWDVPIDGDNLVLAAAERLAAATGVARPSAALRLVKNLPVASGIGGGSADAAAALALCAEAWDVEVPDGLALEIGADVPVCCEAPRPMIMRGIGERLSAGPALPDAWLVLVNPRQPLSTPAVFKATAEKTQPAMQPWPETGFDDVEALADWLRNGRNDLQPAAMTLCPVIAEVLEALSDALMARMSGSGATCFGLFADKAAALAAAERLRCDHPAWWASAGRLTSSG
ncbi:MAG: 4-(cytidine 5'-diphospho)-2-C-methyl-D-erythritol kinase [Pseudomonadota bacterium]